MFAEAFVRAHTKENIKALRHWRLWGESTAVFPHKGPVTRKMFPFSDVIMINYWMNRGLRKAVVMVSVNKSSNSHDVSYKHILAEIVMVSPLLKNPSYQLRPLVRFDIHLTTNSLELRYLYCWCWWFWWWYSQYLPIALSTHFLWLSHRVKYYRGAPIRKRATPALIVIGSL